MTKLSLIEILKELHETNTPVNFKSLLNTLQLCDEIKRYIVFTHIYHFCGYDTMPCYCIQINEYETDREWKDRIGNLWVGFIDNDNVYVLQYYDMNSTEPEHNINRHDHYKDSYDVLVEIEMESLKWERGEVANA